MGDLDIVKAAIDEYPDFPKKGILFQDVFGIFRQKSKMLINIMMMMIVTMHMTIINVILMKM